LPVPAAALTGAPAASLRRWQGYCAGLSDHRLRMAFVRARAIAGDRELRARALETFTSYAYEGGTADGPLVDLRRRLASGETAFDDDVRNGVGGIADVEVFTATLRLARGRDWPGVRTAGTLESIGALAAARVLTDSEGTRLASAFAALRRVEQRLSLARGDVPPTLDDPGGLDLAAAEFGVRTSDALRERLYGERLVVRAICREVLDRI